MKRIKVCRSQTDDLLYSKIIYYFNNYYGLGFGLYGHNSSLMDQLRNCNLKYITKRIGDKRRYRDKRR